MSDNATKPREFWLLAHHSDPDVLVFICDIDPGYGVHVIEKSAYDALQKQLDEAKAEKKLIMKDWDRTSKQVNFLEAENTRLREALKLLEFKWTSVGVNESSTSFRIVSEALKKEGSMNKRIRYERQPDGQLVSCQVIKAVDGKEYKSYITPDNEAYIGNATGTVVMNGDSQVENKSPYKKTSSQHKAKIAAKAMLIELGCVFEQEKRKPRK